MITLNTTFSFQLFAFPRWDHEPELPERTVRIVILPHGPGSLLTLTHGSYDCSMRDQAERQSHHDGWQHFLARLQGLVV